MLRRELSAERQMTSDLLGRLRDPDGTWREDNRRQLRHDNERLRSEGDQLLRERNELRRKLDGARANVTRLAEQRVTRALPARASAPMTPPDASDAPVLRRTREGEGPIQCRSALSEKLRFGLDRSRKIDVTHPSRRVASLDRGGYKITV